MCTKTNEIDICIINSAVPLLEIVQSSLYGLAHLMELRELGHVFPGLLHKLQNRDSPRDRGISG
jgi:hypothetical protein